MNDTVIADPQFSISTTGNASEALCYEVHGIRGRYFNLISDTCTSVNAHFTSMPNPVYGNRMSTIGIHALHAEEQLILGDVASGKCADIRIELSTCGAFAGGEALPDMGHIGQIRYRKYTYKGIQQWRVSLPNCEKQELVLKVTCQPDMLRIDVNRKMNTTPSSHGLIGTYNIHTQLYTCTHTCTVYFNAIRFS